MKKLITLILAVIMIASLFAACNNNPNPPETTKKPAGSEQQKETGGATGGDGTGDATDTPAKDPEKTLNVDLDALDYGNREFYIFHWKTGNPEFAANEEADEGDPINNALYMRNLRIEEGLGIKLNFHGENGGDTEQDAFRNKYETRINDPETPVDIIASYSRTAPYMLIGGHTVDLYGYSDDLDINKVWWPNNVRQEHEIKGRLFYTSGDASTGLLTMMEIFFVNKTMLAGLGHDYEQFVKDVINGKWTIDKFIEMTSEVYQDVDDKPGKSVGDIFGLVTGAVTGSDSLYIGMGYRLFDISSEDDVVYTLSDDLLGENANSYVKKINDWWSSNGVLCTGMNGIPTIGNSNMAEQFSSSKALFLSHRIGYFDASVCEVDFTILPAPKLNEAQTMYLTNVGNPYSLFSISASALDKDLCAQMLQTWGYYGYELTTPAIFEVTFKGKFAKDDYAIQLFDIIRSGITFEIGRTFDRITGTMLPNLLSGTISTNATWTTKLSATKKKVLQNGIDSVNTKLLQVIEIS